VSLQDQLAFVGGGVVVLITMLVWVRAHRRRERRDQAILDQSVSENQHIPASLHPVIDPDLCIGSLSCINACPEGDILGVIDGKAKLIIGANCIGHSRCADECPVDAIKLVFGTAERGVDLPEIDGFFETSRPGVHIVGELGGMGLIKNAIIQGLQVAERFSSQLPSGRGEGGPDDPVDVVIVGAGPAGLATAVGLRKAGLSFRIVEQGTVGGTIAHYPRQKVVMTERVDLPIWGKFGRTYISKEELLATWQKIITKVRIEVEEGCKVTGIEGKDGDFTVVSDRGRVRARKVVLAIGRRGSPRTFGVPGEDLPKVTYNLIDPEQYVGKRTLVVGGGDSAIEAACAIADEGPGEVSISYRGEAFGKCRDRNRKRITELIQSGRVQALFNTTVAQIGKDRVLLKRTDGQQVKLANDYIIGCLGGELPVAFLKNVGVEIKRYHGSERVAPVPKVQEPKTSSGAAPAAKKRAAQAGHLGLWLILAGILIISGLTWMGWEYYLLPKAQRLTFPRHEFLKPAGVWGHGVGIAATLFMLSNFLYAARKRWGWLKGVSSIRTWLTWHMFVGFMSPVVILFHAAFQSNNLVATSTYSSLLVVVGTGIIGRYIFGLVPSGAGGNSDLASLKSELERQRGILVPLIRSWAPERALKLEQMVARASEPPPEGASLMWHLMTTPFAGIGRRLRLANARRWFSDHDQFAAFRYTYLDLLTLRTQVGFYRGLKRFLSVWRLLHVILAVLLGGIIAIHVGISLYLGYTWIFFQPSSTP
jgi:thioredoxin reductase/NAD-dependent dihydropyrimidine dehydrogenase PreA subunit